MTLLILRWEICYDLTYWKSLYQIVDIDTMTYSNWSWKLIQYWSSNIDSVSNNNINSILKADLDSIFPYQHWFNFHIQPKYHLDSMLMINVDSILIQCSIAHWVCFKKNRTCEPACIKTYTRWPNWHWMNYKSLMFPVWNTQLTLVHNVSLRLFYV